MPGANGMTMRGGIEGQAAHFPLDVDREYAKLSRKPELLDEIMEESDEESIGSAASMGEETHEEYIGEVEDLNECNYNGLGAKPADYCKHSPTFLTDSQIGNSWWFVTFRGSTMTLQYLLCSS
jgi:hypothetical protein